MKDKERVQFEQDFEIFKSFTRYGILGEVAMLAEGNELLASEPLPVAPGSRVMIYKHGNDPSRGWVDVALARIDVAKDSQGTS